MFPDGLWRIVAKMMSRLRWTARPGPRFALASIAAAFLLLATYWAFVLTESGQRLENLALAGAVFRDPLEVEGSLAGLSGISVASFGIAIVVVFLAGLARRRPGLAALAAAVMGVSALVAEALKDVLVRPQFFDAASWLLVNTFPSGHATIAAAVGIGALLVAPDRARWIVLPIAAIYAAVIAQAVQVAGWHRLSGTIGGMLVALTIGFASLAVLSARGYVRPSDVGRIHPMVRRTLLGAGGLGLIAAGLMIGLALIFPVLLTPRGSASVFAHTALDLVGWGLTVLFMVAFAGVIEPFTLGARPMIESKPTATVAAAADGAAPDATGAMPSRAAPPPRPR